MFPLWQQPSHSLSAFVFVTPKSWIRSQEAYGKVMGFKSLYLLKPLLCPLLNRSQIILVQLDQW